MHASPLAQMFSNLIVNLINLLIYTKTDEPARQQHPKCTMHTIAHTNNKMRVGRWLAQVLVHCSLIRNKWKLNKRNCYRPERRKKYNKQFDVQQWKNEITHREKKIYD